MKRWVKESDFIYGGLRCVVMFQSLGHRCGYVGVPKGHKFYGTDCGNIYDELDVNGGLTYSDGGKGSEYPIKSNLWWLGFDCGHCWDGRDLELAREYFKENKVLVGQIERQIEMEHMFPTYEYGSIKSLSYVVNECESLVDQINSKN